MSYRNDWARTFGSRSAALAIAELRTVYTGDQLNVWEGKDDGTRVGGRQPGIVELEKADAAAWAVYNQVKTDGCVVFPSSK